MFSIVCIHSNQSQETAYIWLSDSIDFLEEIKFLKEELSFSDTIKDMEYEQIVIAGMGGSGIAGKIFQELYTDKPVRLVEDYRIPKFVNSNTLFIGMSYSGDTEETLQATETAKKAGAHVVTISSGGKLSKIGHQNLIIPKGGLQPRAAVGYLLMPLLLSFNLSTPEEIKKTYAILEALDIDNEVCKKFADEVLRGEKIPIVYAAAPFKSVAYRWKTQLNENAKVICYANYFPELNHNDTMALAKTYKKKMFCFFVIDSEYRDIQRRIMATSQITKTTFHLIDPKGESITEKLFYLIHFGDYLSYYVGIGRGLDPGDVGLVMDFKKAIEDKPATKEASVA